MLLLIIGKPFKGKSVSSLSFPRDTVVFDFDGGMASTLKALDKDGTPLIKEANRVHPITFTRDEFYTLEFKTAQEKGSVMPEFVRQAPKLIEKFNRALKELVTTGSVTVDTGEVVTPTTIVFDTLTEMFRVWKEMVLFINKLPSLRISDWGTLENLFFSQFIPSLRILQKRVPYIIVNTHQTVDKDDLTSRIEEIATGCSANKSRELNKVFDEAWQMDRDGDAYVWRTKQTGTLQIGTRTNLPEVIKPATFSTLETIFKGRR